MHASCESPWHSLAKHHLLGACFPRMVPFRSMLLTLRGGPQCLAPRAHRVPVYPMVFSTFLYRAFTAHIPVAIAGVLIAAIPRGLRLPRAVVRERTTGDHQPFLGPCPFAFQPRLHPSGDHLDRNRAFLPVSHAHVCPSLCSAGLTPRTHRLPGGFWSTPTPLIRRHRRLQVAHRRVTGHPQHIPFATLAQRVTKLRVAPQLIVPRHPAVRHLLAPRVEHLQALLVPRVILHLQRDVARRTPWRIPCPVLGQGQAE